MVLHHGAQLAEARDFSVGSLADGILQEAERGLDRLWRAFVASRLAWEAAGNLGDAQEIDSLVGGVGQGGEGSLEQVLNRWATHRLARIPEEGKRSLGAYLGIKSAPGGEKRDGARLDAEVHRAGLLWRPVGEQRSRPSPWVARALLLAEPMHEARHLLRAAMVNGPLANEILRRCFDLESALVASAWVGHRDLEGQLVSAQDLWRRFLAGRLQEAQYYPADCPARPRDAWSFASLGEVLELAPGLGGRGSPAVRLLRLRNALAHGHYVGWRVVRDVLDIEDELARA